MKKLSFIFLIFIFAIYFIYDWIRSLPSVTVNYDNNVEISAATGEEIFWGSGRCHVCHKIGERGYALRGPNLGEGKEGAVIPLRAQNRAAQAGLASGTDYLVQSIAQPGEFVVPGFNNEMPEVFKAPISLSPAEIKAVILYLESLDGSNPVNDIQLPPQLLAEYHSNEDVGFRIRGNAAAGRDLFFDLQGPAACATCHIGINVRGQKEGSIIGPDLSEVAAIRTPEHLYSKIIQPDSNLVSGYEQVLVKMQSGQFLIGMVQEENEDEWVLLDRAYNELRISRKNVHSVIPQKNSMMPGNYRELLIEKQIQDIIAYLLSLQGVK